jgi:hypothetical protein
MKAEKIECRNCNVILEPKSEEKALGVFSTMGC